MPISQAKRDLVASAIQDVEKHNKPVLIGWETIVGYLQHEYRQYGQSTKITERIKKVWTKQFNSIAANVREGYIAARSSRGIIIMSQEFVDATDSIELEVTKVGTMEIIEVVDREGGTKKAKR